MAIPTSRTKEKATITIHEECCIGCGSCIEVCKDFLAATTAMYAAESLGLGTCMLGAIHPLIQNGKKARQLREKYGIKFPSREGVFVIFGYPKPKYLKGIRRSFASVDFVK